MNPKQKTYTENYKQEAVLLAEKVGTIFEAAKQLGISDSSIHSWKRKSKSSPAAKSLSAAHEEIQALKKENAYLKKINQILKAASAFFSQDHLK